MVAGELLPAPDLPPEPNTATGTGRAAVFLLEHLREGPRPLADLIAEAATSGINRGHLGEAARRLQVIRTRNHHRHFTWALPKPA